MESLKQIQSRIENACRKSGRSRSEITLIAIAKSQPVEKIKEAVRAGVSDIGENYAQEMLEHQKNIEGTRWHFIGHLQRNKVKQIIDRVTLIHSVDSLPLAEEINKQAKKIGKERPILLEINLGQEGSKTGVPYSSGLFDLVSHLNDLPSIRLKGLMVIPPPSEEPEKTRPFFRQLRKLRDEINSRNRDKNKLTELSMGMTQDFEIAIEEGATMIRVGTGIFGARE